MLYNHFTLKLLGIKDVIIKNLETNEKTTTIYLEKAKEKCTCPNCKQKTDKVHGYYSQKIKDIPSFGKQVFLAYRKRRYKCPCCGKCFYEDNSFVARYQRMTKRKIFSIIEELKEVASYTAIGKRNNISVSTVIRIFDNVGYRKPDVLPKVLGIDEFKGNTGVDKYQCILTDLYSNRVIDILPTRFSYDLTNYMKTVDRSQTIAFVSDMWKPYSDLSNVYLKNSVKIVDKYHFIRQAIWAFENARKTEQKKFSKAHRIYFKKSRSLLLKRFDYLSDEQKQQVNVMLYASPNLSSAHLLKEMFFGVLDAKDSKTAKTAMSHWIETSLNCGIQPFEKCAKTYMNWQEGILNSFDYSYTNGFTEGCNNKIKVLKRNAYGFKNFKRFRNRILHIFSEKNSI